MCCLRTYLPATARSRCVCFVCTIDRVIHFASPVHHAQRRSVRFDRQRVGGSRDVALYLSVHHSVKVSISSRVFSVARLLTAGTLALASLQCVHRTEPRSRQVSASKARLATQVKHIIAYLHDFDEQYTRIATSTEQTMRSSIALNCCFGP